MDFEDGDNRDYHLSWQDNAARDAGTNLSTDEFIPFTDDINGNTRVGLWDIGAHESAWISKTTYYSRGPGGQETAVYDQYGQRPGGRGDRNN